MDKEKLKEIEKRVVLAVSLLLGIIGGILLIWKVSFWACLGVFFIIWEDNISKRYFK